MAGSLEEARSWLARAEGTLKAARSLAENGFYNESVSRSYYAMFYAAKAAVTSEGVRSKKHSSVISAFGRLFAKTGRLEPRMHKSLMVAYKQREKADYFVGLSLPEQMATDGLVAAEEFVLAAKDLLAA